MEIGLKTSLLLGTALSTALFHTLIRVGKALKIKVIAEGVETEKERAALLELGADGFSGPAANRVSG